MKNYLVKIGILLGISLVQNFNLSYACQPEWPVPYVHELSDDIHVLVMGAEMKDEYIRPRFGEKKENEALKYPLSGLYLKGHKESPVWEWKGPFLKQSQVIGSLSPDGYYFFHIHDAYRNSRQYLSLYHTGKLFKQFDMEVFLDSPDQIANVPCSSAIWARNWKYDENEKQFIIESFAKRIVKIDAESGVVISKNPIMAKNISGRVHLNNGKYIQVSQIGKCKEPDQKNKLALTWGMEMFQSIIPLSRTQYVRDEDGFTDVPAFTIKTVEDIESPSGSKGTFQLVNYSTVRFDQVSKIDFDSGDKPEEVVGRVKLIDGSTLDWKINSSEWQFCAQRSGQDYIELTTDQLRALYVYSTDTGT